MLSTNRLLRSLSLSDQAHLGALERVVLPLGYELETAGKPTRHVYFLEEGMASIVARVDDSSAEIGLVGEEGFVGTGLLVHDPEAAFICMMQVGGRGLRLDAGAFVSALDASPTLRLTLQRYVRAFWIQVSYTAWSNGHSTIEERLARWLLMVADRCGGTFNITHEYISIMLAVRRSGVTVALHVLEGEHLIRSARGEITVLDRNGLISRAVGGYGPAEDQYRRLMAGSLVLA